MRRAVWLGIAAVFSLGAPKPRCCEVTPVGCSHLAAKCEFLSRNTSRAPSTGDGGVGTTNTLGMGEGEELHDLLANLSKVT